MTAADDQAVPTAELTDDQVVPQDDGQHPADDDCGGPA